MNKFNLDNKTALITGGAGLLGVEHAKALLEQNANVILTDINLVGLKKIKKYLSDHSYDVKKIFIDEMDVAMEDNVTFIKDKYLEHGLRIDILINNAAIDPKVNKGKSSLSSSRLESFDLDNWNNEISVGLTGAFVCSKIFGSMMSLDGCGGVILNIASDLSVIAPDQRLYNQESINKSLQTVKPVTYSVIKSGLIGLTRYLSTYWAERGVRCNAISPGGVFNGQSDEFVAKLERLIPLGRMAASDEYMGTIQYLCSDASRYLNGQNIIVDGGRSVW